ncbi:MAG: diphosphatase [Pseudomonadota bacterium]|jgi:NAD+ diphosphatase
MIQTAIDFQAEVDKQNPTLPALHFVFHGNNILLDEQTQVMWATPEQLAEAKRTVHLGQWQGHNLGAIALPEGVSTAGVFKSLRNTFGKWDEGQIALAGRAHQLLEWQRTHAYCGACGTLNERQPGERAMRCPQCEHSNYPRIAPAMMVLVHKGNQLLLARNVNFPAGRMSALAGFLEAGETVEECIHREVKEEVGLEVNNLRYVASQNWPFPHSLMLAFHADYLGGEITTDPNEIAEASWFGPDDELPTLPPSVSVAAYLINDGLRMKHPKRLNAGQTW